MTERPTVLPDHREGEPRKIFNVTVIGAACSGKSTLLRSFRDGGYTVRPEPDNPVFPLFLENPKKYGYRNQLHKTIQLMELEVLDTKADGFSDPHFRESGVLATAVYNDYLHDQGFMTDEQYNHLTWLYKHHLESFPTPDLIVYLYAKDDVIKTRAVKRDGLVAHDPQALQPYWDKLIRDMENRGIPVYKVDTGVRQVEETQSLIMSEVEKLKKEQVMQEAARPRSLTFLDAPPTGRSLPLA